MATRIAKALRITYPSSQISWLTCGPGAELVSHCPSIDDQSTDISYYKPVNWDLLIVPSVGNMNDIVQGAALRARKRIGLAATHNAHITFEKASEDFFHIRNNKDARAALGISSESLCIEKLGIEPDAIFYDYEVAPLETEVAQRALDQITPSYDKIIGVHFGASQRWDSKKLPLDQVLGLLSELESRLPDYFVAIFVGPREEEFVSRHGERLTQSKKVFLIRGYSVSIVVAMISQIPLVICTDSFVMHAAIAVKTYALGLFGPTNAGEIDFFNYGVPIVAGLHCSPCFAKEVDHCTNVTKMQCLRDLPIESVAETARIYLVNRRGDATPAQDSH